MCLNLYLVTPTDAFHLSPMLEATYVREPVLVAAETADRAVVAAGRQTLQAVVKKPGRECITSPWPEPGMARVQEIGPAPADWGWREVRTLDGESQGPLHPWPAHLGPKPRA